MSARIQAVETARKDGVIQAIPMIASETVYKGTPTLIKSASGHAFSNDGTTNTLAAGDIFAGISVETVTNSGAAASVSVNVYRKGSFLLTFSDTLTQANLGDKVYVNNVSDDNVVTVTTNTGNPQITIGSIVEFVSANTAYVSIDNFVGNVAANA